MSLNGKLNLNLNLTNTKDQVDLSIPTEIISPFISKNISTGSVYHDTLSLSADQIVSIDVGDSSLQDVYGETISFSGVTSMFFNANSNNTSDVLLSGGVNSIINTQPTLGPSEALGFLTDIDVSSNSKLYFVNGPVSGTINLVITGD